MKGRCAEAEAAVKPCSKGGAAHAPCPQAAGVMARQRCSAWQASLYCLLVHLPRCAFPPARLPACLCARRWLLPPSHLAWALTRETSGECVVAVGVGRQRPHCFVQGGRAAVHRQGDKLAAVQAGCASRLWQHATLSGTLSTFNPPTPLCCNASLHTHTHTHTPACTPAGTCTTGVPPPPWRPTTSRRAGRAGTACHPPAYCCGAPPMQPRTRSSRYCGVCVCAGGGTAQHPAHKVCHCRAGVLAGRAAGRLRHAGWVCPRTQPPTHTGMHPPGLLRPGCAAARPCSSCTNACTCTDAYT